MRDDDKLQQELSRKPGAPGRQAWSTMKRRGTRAGFAKATSSQVIASGAVPPFPSWLFLLTLKRETATMNFWRSTIMGYQWRRVRRRARRALKTSSFCLNLPKRGPLLSWASKRTTPLRTLRLSIPTWMPEKGLNRNNNAPILSKLSGLFTGVQSWTKNGNCHQIQIWGSQSGHQANSSCRGNAHMENSRLLVAKSAIG